MTRTAYFMRGSFCQKPVSPRFAGSVTTRGMSLLDVDNLRKSYNGTPAVDGLSFSLEPGEVLGLLGPNGSGKTTTMTMISGLMKPDAGRVVLSGKEMQPHDRELRAQLGVVPQELAIYLELTPRENLTFFGKLYGLNGPALSDKIDDILTQTGLTKHADSLARTFSGGMLRRLNFGVALLHSPRLLILDEPTVGVDPQSRSHLLDSVRKQAQAGVGVLYASHYMEEVEAICDRVAIIDHGKMLVYDRVATLLGRLTADLCLNVVPAAQLAAQLNGNARFTPSPDGTATIHLAANGPTATPLNDRLQHVLALVQSTSSQLKSIETQPASLERLFLELTGRHLRD